MLWARSAVEPVADGPSNQRGNNCDHKHDEPGRPAGYARGWRGTVRHFGFSRNDFLVPVSLGKCELPEVQAASSPEGINDVCVGGVQGHGPIRSRRVVLHINE